ncbi:14-alpha-glucan-branching enzyme [Anaeramoeba ignava]|uniref:1,4-alpha-glucan branching enzyme n=1 Tax=Anaeramoeba ignava TaxID=1746090 RepID=A0A9Q0LBE7_ANAIG|nr:14-alpha-glucan-branching enzyme [Anaeramoeba ignava]
MQKKAEETIKKLIEKDPLLKPYEEHLIQRNLKYEETKQKIISQEISLIKFASAYRYFGFQRITNGIIFREWAPNATEMSLVGEFNGWDPTKHICIKDEYGVFSVIVEDQGEPKQPQIRDDSKIKIRMKTKSGEELYRIPVWSRRTTQDLGNPLFEGKFVNENKYKFVSRSPRKAVLEGGLRIYEAHVGMSSKEPKVSSYNEFRKDILPYIAQLGYNCVQLMAIMEHPYYASFGYQITHPFAPSSRFGSIEDLKLLIDEAHARKLLVILDIVHSHVSMNVEDGINKFDGTDYQYFHSGKKGIHPIWDSRLFNYAKYEVLRLLLSNARYWVEEFNFDGLRFDGVTSMMYSHHGINHEFNSYDDYFDTKFQSNADLDGIVYLMLVNDLVHSLDPSLITIAEDVSGYPGLCLKLDQGGIGFDYRFAMNIPDLWKNLLKSKKDENWNIGDIVGSLLNRRTGEKVIAYAECHDQALVGDKTISFWLMDKYMYKGMSILDPISPQVSRGISLHKIIRLITFSLGGDAYLNFMGNEFGHPEWIDFPREQNSNSFHFCRRRWDLAQDPLLRYHHLLNFDTAMLRLDAEYHLFSNPFVKIISVHEDKKLLFFERSDSFIFLFNFHPSESYTDYRLGSSWQGKFVDILNTDLISFGGFDRLKNGSEYFTENKSWNERPYSLKVYLPSRVAIVLKLIA